MGVHFLQTFIEKKVPGGCKDVNIGDIVKAKKGSRSNILVIDLKAMACKPLEMYDVGKVTKKDVNGGDFIGFKNAWIKFLGRLERAGIKVIFVCDGALPGSRRKVWISRRYEEAERDIRPMLDSIRKGRYPNLDRVPAPNKYSVVKLVKYELGYEDVVFTSSPAQDADKACAGIIEKYKAFGILTNDTDFLIHQFSPEAFVFSIKHLDLETLKTKAYDREKLANYLGLRITQLPLLATLKGNDIVPFKDLTRFHRSLVGHGARFVDALEVIPKLATYIKRECQNLNPDRLAAMLALKIFKESNKAVTIQESLDSYDLTEEVINNPLGSFHVDDDSAWSHLMENTFDYSSKVFQLMCGAPFDWGCCLEDYSGYGSNILPKVGDLLKGLRQRMYGILFYEKPGALNDNVSDFVIKIEELVMTGRGSLEPPAMVKPTMPPLENFPGLETLWKDQKYREYHFDFMKSRTKGEDGSDGCHELRWQLFSWIVNPNLTNLEEKLELYGLDETDLFMICQLYIMQQELESPILTKNEVQSFILVNYRMKKLSNEELMHAPIDFVPKSRPVELATIFWRSLLDVFSACVGDVVARKHFLPYNKFDGGLFQRIYRDFQDSNNNSDVVKTDEYAYVNNVYNIVTSSGSKVAKEL